VGAQRRQRGEPQHTGSYLCPDCCFGRCSAWLSLLPRIQIVQARRLKCAPISFQLPGFPPGLGLCAFSLSNAPFRLVAPFRPSYLDRLLPISFILVVIFSTSTQKSQYGLVFVKAAPHKCNDTRCQIAVLGIAIRLSRVFARKSKRTQVARQACQPESDSLT